MKKNKRLLKIGSIVLALVITFCIVTPAFASAAKEKTPFILVSGMNTYPLIQDEGSENEKQVWPPETNSTLAAVGKITAPLLVAIGLNSWNSFANTAIPVAYNLLSPAACDKNGDSINKISTKTFTGEMENYTEYFSNAKMDEMGVIRAAVEEYGAENVYFFNYDWRLDPMDHADDLNDFVKSVKADTGSAKVILVPCSMGGNITTAYLSKYGASDVSTLIMLSTAFQGVTAVGEIFSGQIYVDKDGLKERVAQLGKEGNSGDVLSLLMNLLDTVGIFDALLPKIDTMTQTIGDRIFDELLIPVFGTMPGFWALVDDENYEDAKEYMLDKTENAKLIERIDDYHYNVQVKAKTILTNAKNSGMKLYIVAQYNKQALPVSPSSNLNNDLLIDVKYASGGAIAADLGETLPLTYTQKVKDGHAHISGDYIIDASTCMFPENTWFIKNMCHVDYPYGGDATDFIMWMATAKTQQSVFSDSNYTQFMDYDYDTKTLTSLGVYESDVSGIFTRIFEYLSELIKSIIQKIKILLMFF